MDVFLSYARSASRPYVEAVYRELGGDAAGLAFLDTEDIEHGDRFPQRLIDALLASHLVVIFADPVYFTRWYCILELRAALAPFAHLAEHSGTTPEERAKALEGLFVVLPVDGARSLDLRSLPPPLQQTDWPTVGDPGAIAAQIRNRLTTTLPTLAERIEATVGVDKFRREWLEVTSLLPPGLTLTGIPFVAPLGLPRSLNERFVGRADDLWRIHYALMTRRGDMQSPAAITVAIEGGAGVGKSRLALEYFWRFGPRYYPGGLFWIEAERPLEPQYYQIARALNPATPDWKAVQSEPDGIRARLVSEFRTLPLEMPALVIIDNIPEPQLGELPKPLYEWFPTVGEVRVLVTSRMRISLGGGGAITSFPVDVLDAGAARALLTRGIDAHAIDDWDEITDWVSCLPLALELLNSALAAHAFTADELLTQARYTETTAVLDEAMDALRPNVDTGSLRGVTEALSLSYERLPDRAKAAARLIALLAPAPIPQALLEAIGIDPFDRTTRSMLITRSFVTEIQSMTVPMFGVMHRVLGDFLRTKGEDRAGELTRLTSALLSVMSSQRVNTPSEWPLMDACGPHAVTLFNHVTAQQPRSEFVEHTVALALALASLFLAQGFPAEASDLTIRTLLACSEETEPGHFSVMPVPAMNELMRIMVTGLTQSGEHDPAIKLQRIFLEWLEEGREADDLEVLMASDNLAWMLYERGHAEDLEEARQIYKRTIPAWKRRDPVSRDTLTALNNLGLVVKRQGNTARAVELFEEVLDGLRHLEHVEMETIETKQSMANSLWETDPERARALLEEALAVADLIQLPDKHRVKLEILKQLGGSAHKGGDYARAQALLQRTVQALAATQGDGDSMTTIYAWALWDAQLQTGDIAAAAETRKRYLEWLRATADEQLTPEQQRIRADLLRRARS